MRPAVLQIGQYSIYSVWYTALTADVLTVSKPVCTVNAHTKGNYILSDGVDQKKQKQVKIWTEYKEM